MSSSTFSSNAVRLSVKEWGAAACALVVVFVATPRVWVGVERFETGADYRFPYEISNDYWLYGRWCKRAAEKFRHVVLGDSVMWGQYVKNDETLTHFLNEGAGEQAFANLGLDGAHPAALSGLVRHYAGDIAKKKVLLGLNLLWMSSPKQDLQAEEEFRFNHPRLVPQVWPDIRCYKPTLPEVVSVTAERYIPFFACMSHVSITYFENMPVDDWTMENPYGNPVGALGAGLPGGTTEAKSKPVSWRERRMSIQEFDWVPLAKSLQWRFFGEVVERLRARGNDVFVLFIGVNPYMQTAGSRKRYNLLKEEAMAWLAERVIPHYLATDLASEQYADASHPLKDGYAKIARDLLEDRGFRKWMGE